MMISSKKRRRLTVGITAVVVALLAGLMVMVSSASATPDTDKKVVVCKYVGKPGVDEVLKGGKNPIVVAVSSIGQNQWNGQIPGYFNDAQDRSYVLGYVGEVSENASCPEGEGPDEETIPVPNVPVNDLCGPGNAVYGEVPAGNYSVVRNGDGSITLTANENFTFPNGKTVTLPAPTDSNEPCPVEDEEINVPVPNQTDPCGVNNASWIVPADTDVFDWSLDPVSGHLMVTIVKDGTVFYDGTSTTPTTNDYGLPVDSGKLCDEGEVGSGGSVSVSSACESITIGQPTYSPDDAKVTIKLNGKPVQPNTYGVKPGTYTVELLVNDESVQVHKLVAKKCASGGNGGGNGGNGGGHNPTPTGGLNSPAYANTGH